MPSAGFSSVDVPRDAIRLCSGHSRASVVRVSMNKLPSWDDLRKSAFYISS